MKFICVPGRRGNSNLNIIVFRRPITLNQTQFQYPHDGPDGADSVARPKVNLRPVGPATGSEEFPVIFRPSLFFLFCIVLFFDFLHETIKVIGGIRQPILCKNRRLLCRPLSFLPFFHPRCCKGPDRHDHGYFDCNQFCGGKLHQLLLHYSQQIVEGVDSAPLLAIPFFILAGLMMNETGLTDKIFDFAWASLAMLEEGLPRWLWWRA